jgi:site-specific DNA recombinase
MKTENTKYFIYARKSTRGEDKQILSIQSQKDALEKLEHDQKLHVVEIITERESAHEPGRPHFNAMMDRIEGGEADGIIAWHPDRLARNSLDGGKIIHFLDVGKLTDLKFATFWFENTPQGKCNLGHEFVQTKQYSDKLSCDTTRGLQQKARMGLYPSLAPRGYVNDKGTKTIILDPTLAPIMKGAFEAYAEGNHTLDDMQDFLAEHGVFSKKQGARRKGGIKIHHDRIRRMLRNPFYYGHFEYAGEVYEGKHPPIISKALFDRVQAVLEKRTHHFPKEREPKAFTRLLQCGECGRAVTAEIQKGHTYYRCTKKSKTVTCKQPFIREEELDRQLSALLSQFTLRPEWADGMLAMLENERKDIAGASRVFVAEKQAELAQVTAKSQRLLDAYLEQLIDRQTFAAQKSELLAAKKALQEQIESCEDNHHAWLEPMNNWIQRAENMGKIALSGSPQEKKAQAAQVFGSNLFLDAKKARGSALKPWSLILESHVSGGMVGWPGLEPGTNALKGHCSTN